MATASSNKTKKVIATTGTITGASTSSTRAYMSNMVYPIVKMPAAIQAILSPPETQSFTDAHSNQVWEVLKQTKRPHKKDDSLDNKKGVCEDFFVKELQQRFDYTISQGLVLNKDNGTIPYYPDITIIDTVTNLHVAIEIDEPYSSYTLDPIHFIGCNDEKRDEYFKNCGWVVIRFAEEQVIKNTQHCIDYTSCVINEILFGKIELLEISLLLLQVQFKRKGLTIPRWTKTDAERYAKIRYRNAYLGRELVAKPKEISKGNNQPNGFIDELPF